MKELKFSHNWNNKLENDCFTTIRLSKTYNINDNVRVAYKGIINRECTIIGKWIVKINQLSEYTCRLDTGYSKEDTIRLILAMYKHIGITDNDNICVYLLKRRDMR